MRGKDYADFDHTCKNGITPAYAGKSGNVGKSGFYRRDHPRLCGEKLGVRACIQA